MNMSLNNIILTEGGLGRMVVGFTTTYVISAYHPYLCEFESRSGELYSIKHYVMKLVVLSGFFHQ